MVGSWQRGLAILCALYLGEGALYGQEANLWGVDSLTKIMRSASPPRVPQSLRMEGARGETVSGQLAFRSARDAKTVRAEVTALKHGTDEVPAAAVRLRWVRYINIRRNSAGVPEDELVAKAPCALPDPFWDTPTVDIPTGTVQPLWIEVDVPREAGPGEYVGTITLRWGGTSASLPLRLTVWDFEMPRVRHQQVSNWFAFPGGGYRAAWGSPEFWELADKYARIMAGAPADVFQGGSRLDQDDLQSGEGLPLRFPLPGSLGRDVLRRRVGADGTVPGRQEFGLRGRPCGPHNRSRSVRGSTRGNGETDAGGKTGRRLGATGKAPAGKKVDGPRHAPRA